MDKQKKYKIGFTAGVFDMFHVGHLNLIKKASEFCDKLIVGVNSDELVKSYKNKSPVIPFDMRVQIVEAIRYVHKAIKTETLDKVKMHDIVDFDVVFIGDDWRGTERWNRTEYELSQIGVDVVYLPYTNGISSTSLRKKLTNSEHSGE